MDRADWIRAAREALIRVGYAAVKVDRLSRGLQVTRGSFYWHFRHRAELLEAVLADWERTNSAAFFTALDSSGSPHERLRSLGRVWLSESDYDPAYDSAVRDWGRVSKPVEDAVRRVDDARIAGLALLFLDAGYPEDEAFIRARVTYFHQVGYYAMGVRESRETRDRYFDLYVGVLMGAALPTSPDRPTGTVLNIASISIQFCIDGSAPPASFEVPTVAPAAD